MTLRVASECYPLEDATRGNSPSLADPRNSGVTEWFEFESPSLKRLPAHNRATPFEFSLHLERSSHAFAFAKTTDALASSRRAEGKRGRKSERGKARIELGARSGREGGGVY